MNTELPPCPLPCGGGDHHFHDVEAYAAEKDKTHDCATHARDGFRCYSPHQPGLPEPIDLPEVTAEMVESVRSRSVYGSLHSSSLHSFAVGIRAALLAAIPQWQPIELDQIRAGMRIRVTVQCDDRTTFHVGVAHHQLLSRVWCTEGRWPLDNWGDSVTYEVDPATVPDPDAELIEKIGKAIHDADVFPYQGTEHRANNAYRELAWVALVAVRTHDEGGDGR